MRYTFLFLCCRYAASLQRTDTILGRLAASRQCSVEDSSVSLEARIRKRRSAGFVSDSDRRRNIDRAPTF